MQKQMNTRTETEALGERNVRTQLIADAGTTVARAHAEPVLVVVVGTRLALGARWHQAAGRVSDKVAGETRNWTPQTTSQRSRSNGN